MRLARAFASARQGASETRRCPTQPVTRDASIGAIGQF